MRFDPEADPGARLRLVPTALEMERAAKEAERSAKEAERRGRELAEARVSELEAELACRA